MISGTVQTHCVYRLFREDGLLLYLGYTGNLARRMREHNRAWYGRAIASISVERFATRSEAMANEFRLIQELRPWNLQVRRSA